MKQKTPNVSKKKYKPKETRKYKPSASHPWRLSPMCASIKGTFIPPLERMGLKGT